MIFENTFPREKPEPVKVRDGYVIETVWEKAPNQKFRFKHTSIFATLKKAIEAAQLLQNEHESLIEWHIYDQYDHVQRGWRKDPDGWYS